MTIAQMTSWPVSEAESYFRAAKLLGREAEIARDIVAELQSRLRFLDRVGLSYLSLDRAAPTLSGGEAQRIRLASQLGSNLRGVCYILDEPTIGLHPRDNLMLLDTLHELEAKRNTVVVVEHDEDTIRHAEHIIDLGPGAGANGGRLVAEGTIQDILRSDDSLTGKLLRDAVAASHERLVAQSRAAVRGDRGCAPAQPEGSAREDSAAASRLRFRRERQRQEHAGAGCVA
jgi:excinuclease ABC subunit A